MDTTERSARRQRMAERRFLTELSQWQEEHDRMVRELALARAGALPEHPVSGLAVPMQRGERPVGVVEPVRLVETGPAGDAGHLTVAERVRAAWARFVTPIRSALAPGILARRAVDTGTLTITDRRIVFTGARGSREWPLDRVVRVKHFNHPPWSAIELIDGGHLSGFAYGRDLADDLRLRMKVALAGVDGRRAALAEELRTVLETHAAERPVPGGPERRRARVESGTAGFLRARISVEPEVLRSVRIIGLVAVVCLVIIGVALATSTGGGGPVHASVTTVLPAANTPCAPSEIGVTVQPGTAVELTCLSVDGGPTWVWTPPMAGAPCEPAEVGLVAGAGGPEALTCSSAGGSPRWTPAPPAS